MPFGVPIPPSPGASSALFGSIAERGIVWQPERRVALLSNDEELPFDLFLGVPVYRAPPVVEVSSLAVDGWIPVNRLTLETALPDVDAAADVTSVETPKAGVFSEGQASAVADQIIARVRTGAAPLPYDGRGVCYLEFGAGLVATVDVAFLSGEAPKGEIEGPSCELAASKTEFGASRIQLWFDRSWDGGKRTAG
jgi:sulfide:quinone oxidoreductase